MRSFLRVLGAVLSCAVLSGSAIGAVAQPQEGKGLAATSAAPLNLNQATATELERLPGVGPAMATRILEYRQKNGSFKKVEELMNIQGIGEKNFLKLRTLVVVGPARPASER